MSNYKILLVDDEPQVTSLLKLLLDRQGGFTVLVENDSRCALRAAKEFLPDLVFCDVDMPNLDGGGVAAALKSGLENPVPLVFLTSLYNGRDGSDGPKKVGEYQMLSKPLKFKEVLAIIQAILPRVADQVVLN